MEYLVQFFSVEIDIKLDDTIFSDMGKSTPSDPLRFFASLFPFPSYYFIGLRGYVSNLIDGGGG